MHDHSTLTGDKLSQADRLFALRAYIHRFTKEHTPVWARRERAEGRPYPVQFASDADWLANTRFAVTRTNQMDRTIPFCMSSPTWPDNPELRA